jgi:hypothetical protein
MTTSTDQKTYPLPPAPAWATNSYQDGDRIYHELELGKVGVFRADDLTIEGMTVGDVYIRVHEGEDETLTPAEAKALASELVRAANAIDQG